MRIITLFMVILFTAASVNAYSQPNKAKKDSVYTCPMHPEVKEQKAGKCPQCKMALTRVEVKKNKYVCPMHADVVSDKAGKCSKCKMELEKAVKKSYSCPMHANEVSDEPGKCSKCGMALKEEKKTADQ